MPLATLKEYIIFHTLCTKVYIISLLKENKDILQLMVEFCLHLIILLTKIIASLLYLDVVTFHRHNFKVNSWLFSFLLELQHCRDRRGTLMCHKKFKTHLLIFKIVSTKCC